jgi:hypothetical protein
MAKDVTSESNGYVRRSTCEARHQGLNSKINWVIALIVTFLTVATAGLVAAATKADAGDVKVIEATLAENSSAIRVLENTLNTHLKNVDAKLDRLLETKERR